MPEAPDPPVLAAARELLSRPLTFAEVLAKLGGRDRANAGRRVTVLAAQADAGRARVWQRLACGLMTLAPLAKFTGTDAVEFYVPDGRYRMQVFALEDLRDGGVTVYCPDVLADAVAAGLLADTGHPEPGAYAVAAAGEPLHVEALDGSAAGPHAHVKNLTNWSRRAVRVALPPSASDAQVEVVELLCAIAAVRFAPPPPPGDAARRPNRKQQPGTGPSLPKPPVRPRMSPGAAVRGLPAVWPQMPARAARVVRAPVVRRFRPAPPPPQRPAPARAGRDEPASRAGTARCHPPAGSRPAGRPATSRTRTRAGTRGTRPASRRPGPL
jgi:hypothetical protein